MIVDASLSVQVNGERHSVPSGISVAALVAGLGLDPRKVAVERNLQIVPRSLLDQINVEDGDDYEIVHFVGGG